MTAAAAPAPSSPPPPDSTRGRRKWVGHGMSNRWIYGGTSWGCTHLPLPVLHGMSLVGNEIALALMKRTRAAVAENLRIALDLPEREARRLARRQFHSYGYNVIDLFRIRGGGTVPPVTTYERDAETIGKLLGDGRGCLIVTGHVGNWEMGSMSLRAHGIRSAVVGQPELDPNVHAIRLEVRSRLGVETIDIGSSMATAFRVRDAISRGLAVAMVADRAYLEDQVTVPFFGRPTPFLRSPALLARFCDCPILPSFFLRNDDGSYRSHFGEPIRSDPSLSPEEDATRILTAIAAVVERAIREAPDQWYNFYPYWTTPLGSH